MNGGVTVQPLEARSTGEVEGALSATVKSRCDALIVLQEGVTFVSRSKTIDRRDQSALRRVDCQSTWVDDAFRTPIPVLTLCRSKRD